MRPFFRAAASFAAVLALANCTTPGVTPQITRSLPAPPAQPEVGRASGNDLACLAEAVYFEARGTGTTGESAVAHVVLNRAGNPSFPQSVCGVVGDGCQFSYRCDGRADTLADPRARAKAFKIAEDVLHGAPDMTQGAVFFHSVRAAPGWFSTRPRTGTFGGNIFYR